MQKRSQCIQCDQKFDTHTKRPLKLDCSHILCQSCVVNSFKQNKWIQCPWQCVKRTEKEPYELDLVMDCLSINEEQKLQHKFNECELHQGQMKLLFCKQDMKSICGICAQFTQAHKNHQIIDIQEQIQSLKENEVKKEIEDLVKVTQNTEQCLKSLNEEKQKNLDQGEQVIKQINEEIDNLKSKIDSFKQKVILELLTKQEANQKWYAEQINKTQNLMNCIQKVKPVNEENVNYLLDFIGESKLIKMQERDIQSKQIIVEYGIQKNQIQKIEEEINKLVAFKFMELQIYQQNIQTEIKTYSTILPSTNTKRSYNFIEKKFENQNIQVPKSDGNSKTYKEQIHEQKLIISGGNLDNSYQRFIVVDNENIQTFQMLYQRQ